MDGLARELLVTPETASAWDRFRELPQAEREGIVDGLKERLDFLARSKPTEALGIAEVMLRATQDLPSRRALAYRGRGAAHYFGGATQEALDDFLLAARIYEERGEDLPAAQVGRSLIEIYQSLGRHREALECGLAALAVCERAGDAGLLAQVKMNLGVLHFRTDQYEKAREFFAEALKLFLSVADEVGVAKVQNNLGNLASVACRFDLAEAAYSQARNIWSRHGIEGDVAEVDFNIAYAAYKQSQFGRSLRALEEVRAEFVRLEKKPRIPMCDLRLAEVYLRLDARFDALDMAEQAVRGFEELGHDYDRARGVLLRGLARARLGLTQAALEDLDLAKQIFQTMGNRTMEAGLEIQRCTILLASGQSEAAVVLAQRARESLEESGHAFLASFARVILLEALVRSGRPDEALKLLSEEGDDAVADVLLQAHVRRAEALAQRAKGRPDAAVRAFERAVDAIEATYSDLDRTDVRTAFFRQHQETYEDLAALHLKQPGPEAARIALSWLERGRMRSLSRNETWSMGRAPEFEEARRQMDAILSRRLEAELGGLSSDPDARVVHPTEDEFLAANRRLAEAAKGLLESSDGAPQHTASRGDELTAEADEVLITHLATDDELRVFVVQGREVQVYELSGTTSEVVACVERLSMHVRKAFHGRAYLERHRNRLQTAIEALLDELGELLLGPIRDALGARRLVIVPSGVTHPIPFHALRLGGRFLAETHEVSYAPSIRRLHRARSGAELVEGPLLLAGSDPDLAAVLPELERIEAIFGPRAQRIPPTPLLEGLRTGATGGSVLHLAGHGRLDPKLPQFSGIRLGSSFLTVFDIRHLQVPFDLVTLSGCQTGRGALIGRTDRLGPDVAFQAAGCRSVVSSLWHVGDEQACEFMTSFYQHLGQGSTAVEAITRAQREALALDPHPFGWASFVLSGDPGLRLGERASN